MAVSKKALETLLRHGENDNVPWRGSPWPERRLPSTNPAELDIDYRFLSVRLDAATGVLWAEMRHTERACYTPGLMRDMRAFQALLRERYSGRSTDEMPFRWLVWTSQAPKVWSLGGDLTTFTRMIRAGDVAGLRAYAHLAIEILHDNLVGLDLPILTVALIRGDAIGGGFEAMLTDDVVIAEEGARFGLPEILFNLFPGMGGYSFLRRKVGPQLARTLLEDGITRSASEAKALGLVDRVCASGEAERALRDFLTENDPRFATLLTLKRVRDRVDPVTRRELIDVVDMWVELAMGIGEAELRRMDCLARVQERRRAAA